MSIIISPLVRTTRLHMCTPCLYYTKYDTLFESRNRQASTKALSTFWQHHKPHKNSTASRGGPSLPTPKNGTTRDRERVNYDSNTVPRCTSRCNHLTYQNIPLTHKNSFSHHTPHLANQSDATLCRLPPPPPARACSPRSVSSKVRHSTIFTENTHKTSQCTYSYSHL